MSGNVLSKVRIDALSLARVVMILNGSSILLVVVTNNYPISAKISYGMFK